MPTTIQPSDLLNRWVRREQSGRAQFDCNESIGLRRVARRAGTQVARRAARISVKDTPVRRNGFSGRTPMSGLRRKRPNSNATEAHTVTNSVNTALRSSLAEQPWRQQPLRTLEPPDVEVVLGQRACPRISVAQWLSLRKYSATASR